MCLLQMPEDRVHLAVPAPSPVQQVNPPIPLPLRLPHSHHRGSESQQRCIHVTPHVTQQFRCELLLMTPFNTNKTMVPESAVPGQPEQPLNQITQSWQSPAGNSAAASPHTWTHPHLLPTAPCCAPALLWAPARSSAPLLSCPSHTDGRFRLRPSRALSDLALSLLQSPRPLATILTL